MMVAIESDDRKPQKEALREAEAIIRSALNHGQKGHEGNSCPGQTRQSRYCVVCGRRIDPYKEKRVCMDCREELEEWGQGVYTELYCNNCGTPYSPESKQQGTDDNNHNLINSEK